MKKVSKEQFKIRDEFRIDTGLEFFDNVPKYADWLEERYAALRIHDVVGQSEQLLPKPCKICKTDIRIDVGDGLCAECWSRQ
jgi:hypothetical protein